MDTIIDSSRLALRRSRQKPAWTIAVVLILGVAFAANAVAFTLVRSILHRALPFPDPDALVLVASQYGNLGGTQTTSSVPHYLDRIEEISGLSAHGLFRPTRGTIEIDGVPQRVREMTMTPSLFHTLGVEAAVGRIFVDADAEAGATNAVILSHGLWLQMFDGDPSMVGTEMPLNGLPTTIVGVMPEGFAFIDPGVQIWIPMSPDQVPGGGMAARHANNWTHVARVAPGSTLSEVRAQAGRLAAAELAYYPQFTSFLVDAGYHVTIDSLREILVRDSRSLVYFLWAGAGLLLVIGVVNVGGLALARSSFRRTEFAMLRTLGAGRWRMFWQSFVENLPAALGGGALGLGLAAGTLWALPGIGFDRLPRGDELALDAVVYLVAMATPVAAALVIGALQYGSFLRSRPAEVLAGASSTRAGGPGRTLVRRGLVTAQIALASVLLAGSGLLLGSFLNVLDVDPGFAPEGVMTTTITPSQTARLDLFIDDVLRSVVEIPGVEAAGATTNIPFGSDQSGIVFLEDRPGETMPGVRTARVTPGYFETMGIAIVDGRGFDPRDAPGEPEVAIVDQRLAASFWPGQRPIGRRVYGPGDADNNRMPTSATPFKTVIGVVENVRYTDPASEDPHAGTYYRPYAQLPERNVTVALRTTGDPRPVMDRVRAEVARIDPRYPLYDTMSMIDRMDQSLMPRRAALQVASAFAVLALLLAAVGAYGLVAYSAAFRRREIGLRLALGSPPRLVFWRVFSEGARVIAVGLSLGLATAAALGGYIDSQLYGVTATDPTIIGLALLVLAASGLVAAMLPAVRAARADPSDSLRAE